MIRRRTILLGGMAVALTPAAVWAAVASGEHPIEKDRLALLDVLSDLVLPETGTPGAAAVGTGAFVALAVAHGLNHSKPGDLASLESELHPEGRAGFLSLESAGQFEVLDAIDAAAFGPAKAPSAWPVIKGLILMGYYTSEVGASQELRYKFVPGRYEPDIPFKAGEQGWANDWWGNLF